MARAERDWLDSARMLVSRGDLVSAQAMLSQALAEFPDSVELLRALAGIFQQSKRIEDAERILNALLLQHPDDAASAFALAHTLREQGRMAAAAEVLRACLATERNRGNADLAIAAIELLVDCDRHRDAATIAEGALAATPDDPRLHAYAGMLAVQLGEFERARQGYLFALQREPLAYEWHVPIGLSSTLCYPNAMHPDFALFRTGLQRTNLSGLARAELHFALGKAHDDLGDYAEAARHFKQGNGIRHRLTRWPSKTWRRMIEARLSSKCSVETARATEGFTPVFIVGMPRSGTTLLAELLSRRPNVCNRGELPWLARLAQNPDLNGRPVRSALQRAASHYATQARQDDAADARWFLDKQPLNFRYIDLALAMFPDARVLHCQRAARDTALSIWMQCFLEDVQGYSYDFSDIAVVMRDEQRLMSHWHTLYPESVRDVQYEDLVANPSEITDGLASWLGLPTGTGTVVSASSTSPVTTASLWQVRQPIHSKSVGRWQHYAPYLPDLTRLSET